MMQHSVSQGIVAGTVLEFFDAKRIMCAVCLEAKGQRFRVLTEQNREAGLSQSRVIHSSRQSLDLKLGRDELVRRLQEIATLRKGLMQKVNAEELWSLLEGEEAGFDALDLAEMIFTELVTDNHAAAVQRVLLEDRLFFQFKDNRFQARSLEKVDLRRIEIEREEERESQLIEGAHWLQAVWQRKPNPPPFGHQDRAIEALKSFCAFGQDSPDYAVVKELFKRTGIPAQFQSAFRLLVRLGVWTEDENIYLYQQGVSNDFPKEVVELAAKKVTETLEWDPATRRDLRQIDAFTVDSSLTRDYDDALSIRTLEGGLYEVGVHIADAAHFVAPDDPLDLEARDRASTIYLPDSRIPMIPPSLSEGVCSLCEGEDRLALSFLVRIDEEGEIHGYEIIPSVVNIRDNMTYQEVIEQLEQKDQLKVLFQLGLKLREKRLARGAIILPLPEIHVFVNTEGMIQVSHYEKETPSQIMVSEWMIAINGLAGDYLAEHSIPAIFRGQAECKPETEPIASAYPLFHVYRQRRLFARAELDTEPHTHCSLGLAAYTSVSSPIRRYTDLVIQRQLKHFFVTGEPLYSESDLHKLIDQLGISQSKIFFIQRKWNRYWILKYLEQEYIHTLDALVLGQNERFTHLLLPDFLIEINMPVTNGLQLQRGELIQIKIERLNPREDILRVHL